MNADSRTPINTDGISEASDIHLHWLTLTFTACDKHLEQPFQDRFFAKNLQHFRNCHLYTIFFYALAGVIDYIVFPRNVGVFFFIRFLIVIPVFVLGLGVTFTDLYKRWWPEISFGYILLTGNSFIAFTIIAAPPQAYEYYVGILFCMIFGYTFIRERFLHASVAGLILVSAYLFVSAVVLEMPKSILFQSNFYLITVNFLGMLIARYHEVSARRDFYLEHQLSEERRKVTDLNNALERRVSERTRELKRSNEMLRNKIDALNKSESERRKLETQLRQAQKMEAIGTLAGGIAHDFNNILSAVMGYTELALETIETGSTLEKYLQEVYIAGKRARDLVRQILAFARQSEEAASPIQVSPIVKEILKLLRSSIPSSIAIESDIKSDAAVIADPINMHQVIMNLATNASHAMADGGVLEIGTADVTITDDAPPALKHITPGDYLKISVADTGVGIPPENMAAIFDPYFTTKPMGEGTGMGLAMVYGIVKKYNGDIMVESEPGRGSVFSVFLPAARKAAPPEPFHPETLPTGDERILIVDDEPPIVEMERRLLESLGYRTTVRTSSLDALALFRSRPGDFDLVITDMTMPEMTGDKLAIEMLKIQPEIAIIICTGYSKRISEDRAREIGAKALAFKPVAKGDLAATVRRALDDAKKGGRMS